MGEGKKVGKKPLSECGGFYFVVFFLLGFFQCHSGVCSLLAWLLQRQGPPSAVCLLNWVSPKYCWFHKALA